MWFTPIRRTAVAGAIALTLAATALGVAFAQQTPTLPSPGPSQQGQPRPGMQEFQQALARQLGITVDRLQQAMTAARNEVGASGQGVRPPGGGQRHGPPGGPGGDLTVAAQAIGISVEQLRQELPGRSLAAVAQAHGRNPADVANALKNAASQRIDERVNQVVPVGGPRLPGPAAVPTPRT